MKKRKNPKRRVLENIAKKLDIPEDIIFNIPRITMMANKEIRIENCNSVLEYESDKVTVSATDIIVELLGEALCINIITDDEILVCGNIMSINFSKIGA